MKRLIVVMAYGLLCAASLLPLSAQAQREGRSIIVRSLPHESNLDGANAINQLAIVLRRQNVAIMQPDEARAQYELRESFESMPIEKTEVDELARDAQKAMELVAMQRYERAREKVQEILDKADLTLESLNRQLEKPRHVFNSCMYLTRTMVENNDESGAIAQSKKCRALVPDVEADYIEHPPEVLAVLKKAEAELAAEPHGTLSVESTPSGCSVYLNGRRFGKTPMTEPNLMPGEYRLQVECEEGKVGRVHRVILAAENMTVHIDSRVDAHVRTRGDLHLTYKDVHEEDEMRMLDALSLGRSLEAKEVFIATLLTPTVIRIDRIDVNEAKVLASVVFRTSDTSEPSLSQVAKALKDEVSMDFTGPVPKETATWQPNGPLEFSELSEDGSLPEENTSPGVLGYVLGGLGLAALGTSWVFYGIAASKVSDFEKALPSDTNYLSLQNSANNSVLPPLLIGGSGALLTTLALPMFLPSDDSLPWWSFAFLGAGAALAATGAVVMLSEDCDGRVCTNTRDTQALGGLLMEHAVPLLSVPFIYAIRALFDDSEDAPLPAARASRDGFMFSLSGRF
ncbi:MAG: PEGA domain-containing protein [Myxococcales bacterium]|nr:MAG: PEGA domain-containing protein [Myxococcales bacterium]